MTAEEDLKSEKAKRDAFSAIFEAPLVKMALAQIPAGDNPDCLRCLMEEVFNKGFLAGQGDIALRLLSSMREREQQDRT